MSRFEIGDKVICIRQDSGKNIKLDRIYTVIKLKQSTDSYYDMIDIDHEQMDLRGGWYADRFKKVTPLLCVKSEIKNKLGVKIGRN